MTTAAGVLLGLAALVAVTDWWATATGRTSVRWVTKPGAMVFLIAAVAACDTAPGAPKGWFMAALVLSLAGDVFLMLPERWFVAGLGSFLVGHIAYVAGLVSVHESWPLTFVGVVLCAALLSMVGPRVVAGAKRHDAALAGPVVVYMAVISAMVVAAFGSAIAVAVAGALLFYASDATLAWNRFVTPLRWGNLAVMVTYHLGQAGLALSLL